MPDPTPLEPAIQVTDVRALRALAHPLRSQLLGRLRLDGPATASQLGRLYGESSGATSYHLRQLAAYGFVEEVEGQGTARERWWRARHRMTSWQAADVVAQEGGAEVEDEMIRMQLDQHGRVLNAWREQKEPAGPGVDGGRLAQRLRAAAAARTGQCSRRTNSTPSSPAGWTSTRPMPEPRPVTWSASCSTSSR